MRSRKGRYRCRKPVLLLSLPQSCRPLRTGCNGAERDCYQLCRGFHLGGQDDIGKEMPEETKKAIVSRLSGFGYKFLYYEDLDENIAVRQSIYEAGAEPACFINAGGNLMGFGGGTEMVSAVNGIILPGKSPVKGHGLIPLFLNRGVPVIHLLNMKGLLPAYGLPFDPSPIPAAGEGGVYDTWQYHLPLAVGLLLTGLVLLIWAAKKYPHRKIPL